PADAGAGDRLQVHGVLGGELADQRGDVGGVARAGQRRGRRVLLGLRVRRGLRRARLVRGRLGLGRHLADRGRVRRRGLRLVGRLAVGPGRLGLAVRGRRGVGGRRGRGRAGGPGRGRGGGRRGRRGVAL